MISTIKSAFSEVDIETVNGWLSNILCFMAIGLTITVVIVFILAAITYFFLSRTLRDNEKGGDMFATIVYKFLEALVVGIFGEVKR